MLPVRGLYLALGALGIHLSDTKSSRRFRLLRSDLDRRLSNFHSHHELRIRTLALRGSGVLVDPNGCGRGIFSALRITRSQGRIRTIARSGLCDLLLVAVKIGEGFWVVADHGVQIQGLGVVRFA